MSKLREFQVTNPNKLPCRHFNDLDPGRVITVTDEPRMGIYAHFFVCVVETEELFDNPTTEMLNEMLDLLQAYIDGKSYLHLVLEYTNIRKADPKNPADRKLLKAIHAPNDHFNLN